MPERTSYKPGTPCWVDLSTPDLGAAIGFYRELFGWTEREVPGGYRLLLLRDRPVAGAIEQSPEMMEQSVPAMWTTYIAGVADDEVGAVRANGGGVVTGPADAADFGRVAVCTDPEGAMFGVWQGRSLPGAAIVNEPGSVSWSELNTRSLAEAINFYTAVFGWECEKVETGEGGPAYITWMVGGEAVGGALEIRAEWGGMSPQWATYFAVGDADAAVATVESGGGQIFTQPRDSEFGRWATVADPLGASFVLVQLPEPA